MVTRKTTSLFAFILLLSFAVAGCSATTLQNVWKEDGFAGPVSSVLVLGATKHRALRQMYESELSRQLQAAGVVATPSFTLFDGDGPIDKETILRHAAKKGIAYVLVTTVLDVKSYRERITDIDRTWYPVDYRYSRYYKTYRRPVGWYDSYWSGHTTVRNYDIEYRVAYAETMLYRLEDEKMVWSALTETEAGEKLASSVADLSRVLVRQLKGDALL